MSQTPLSHCTGERRTRALDELGAELEEFSHDGLTVLLDDLDHGLVLRGSWGGCVLSYKRGAPGSARKDRLGRVRNPFTVLWDAGWLTDEEVAAAVGQEISDRFLVADPVQGPQTLDRPNGACEAACPPEAVYDRVSPEGV